MSNENIKLIIYIASVFIFIFGFISCCIFCDKLDKDYELKKLGILKPNNKNIKLETDYNSKLKYHIKQWIITIISILIICIICKLFGFGIDDIVNLID